MSRRNNEVSRIADIQWHGWQLGEDGPAIHVGPYPRRRAIALARAHEGTSRVLAYFRSENDAKAFMQWVDDLTRPQWVEPAEAKPEGPVPPAEFYAPPNFHKGDEE